MVTSMMPNMKSIELILSDLWPERDFRSQYLRSETKSQHAFGPFFAIIWAVMDGIERFFGELFRIKGDNYDAKCKIPRINIK